MNERERIDTFWLYARLISVIVLAAAAVGCSRTGYQDVGGDAWVSRGGTRVVLSEDGRSVWVEGEWSSDRTESGNTVLSRP